jgi:hypothetical protein
MSVQMYSYFKNLLVGLEMMVAQIKTKENVKVVSVQKGSWECSGLVQDLPNLGIRLR